MMGECRLFARDIETPQDREKALAYAAPFKDECSSCPRIYISGYSLLPRCFGDPLRPGNDGTKPLYVRLLYQGSLIWLVTVKRC